LPAASAAFTRACTVTSISRHARSSAAFESGPWPGMIVVSGPACASTRSAEAMMPASEPPLDTSTKGNVPAT
jgi:hypothetical protein